MDGGGKGVLISRVVATRSHDSGLYQTHQEWLQDDDEKLIFVPHEAKVTKILSCSCFWNKVYEVLKTAAFEFGRIDQACIWSLSGHH